MCNFILCRIFEYMIRHLEVLTHCRIMLNFFTSKLKYFVANSNNENVKVSHLIHDRKINNISKNKKKKRERE